MRSLALILTVSLDLVLAKVTLVDLTHGLGEKTIYWPSAPPFDLTNLSNNSVSNGGVLYANFINTPEHIGTHMDAPKHFCPQGRPVSELTLDELSGPGVVLDFQTQAANKDYLVTLQDVKNWEAKYGQIPEGAIVLLKFGWNQYWPNWEQVFNTDNIKNFSSFHWPGLNLEASEYIAGTRKVHAVGTDTPSGDPGQGTNREIHIKLLCDHGIIILENVGNINALPATGSRVYVGAVKLEKGSGVPVRLFAILDDEGDPNGASGGETTLNMLFSLVIFTLVMLYM